MEPRNDARRQGECAVYTLVKHVKPFPRSFPLLPQVDTIGFLPRKWESVNRVFDTCNFSFILRGRGRLRLRERVHAIEAPCFFFQTPGERYDYGPEPEPYWDELFFIYDPDATKEFLRIGFIDFERPVRRLEDAAGVMGDAEALQVMLGREVLSADRVDLFCYSMILKSMLGNGRGEEQNAGCIPEIQKRLSENFGSEVDMRALAAEFGMSISTLRRYWIRRHGPESFSAYRSARFLQESCRLLVETGLPIKTVAARLGFDDPCYFSRKLHALLGMTPTEYRRRNRSFAQSIKNF